MSASSAGHRDIARADAREFSNQYPAYEANIPSKLLKTLGAPRRSASRPPVTRISLATWFMGKGRNTTMRLLRLRNWPERL